jgi:aminoglycoside phosphotransferase (APT) family kinase protein
LQARPSPEAIAWVEETLGGGARVVAVRRMIGGVASQVHHLTVVERGRRDDYVPRSWDGEVSAWATGQVRAETAILSALARTDIPAPRVVASSDAALLMTLIPGEVHLEPSDRWLEQMARMLVRIHALDLDLPPFESWLDHERLAPPPDAAEPGLWREAFALVATPPPTAAPRVIHRDYQHFNLLWSDARLVGVVDWGSACLGAPGVDVGHCRLNLALLFSVDLAERFRDLYEVEAGRRVDAWWDVAEILAFGPDWRAFLPHQVGDRAPLDVTGMTARVEDLLSRALRR